MASGCNKTHFDASNLSFPNKFSCSANVVLFTNLCSFNGAFSRPDGTVTNEGRVGEWWAEGTWKLAIATSFGVLNWHGGTEENTKIFRKSSRSLDRGLNLRSSVKETSILLFHDVYWLCSQLGLACSWVKMSGSWSQSFMESSSFFTERSMKGPITWDVTSYILLEM